jgi:hypothetical protein
MAPAETLTNTEAADYLQILVAGGIDVQACETAAVHGAAADIETAMNNAELKNMRLLTEVSHLRKGRRADGSFPAELLEGVFENLVTKVQEDAMSHAVSRSYQPAAETQAENSERRRTFIWKGLGRTAIEVAESGYRFHTSDAAFQRVGIEVREAQRSSTELRPGVLQTFVSPKMSNTDAPQDIAKMEHLAEEDAVRVCQAATDDLGRVIGRRMQSLLVRDISLDAWVALFKDPNNIFGKAFAIQNETSALGVMELFNQLDLPEAALPEGPVTLVAAVIPYITDAKSRASVEAQVAKFRQDQDSLRAEAEATAREWLQFEQSLATGLETNVMPAEVKRLVMLFQSDWAPETLQLLKAHEQGSGYRMSIALAAHLEQAWQKAYLGEVAAAVGDERALKDVDTATASRLQQNALMIRQMQRSGASYVDIEAQRAMQLRDVVRANVRAGGGCSGENEFLFGRNGDAESGEKGIGADTNNGDGMFNTFKRSNEGIGEVHNAVCRTDGCPSRPTKTRVGGCDVCLKYCQPLYDRGKNPESVYGTVIQPAPRSPKDTGEKQYIGTFLSSQQEKVDAENKVRITEQDAGKVALAGVG